MDDLQTLIFVIGLSNKELQRELLKHINSMHSSKTASLSFTAAYRICKDHLAYNDLCRTIHSGSTKSELIYQIHNQEEEPDKMDDTKRDTDNENLLFKITDQKDQSHRKTNERQFKDIQTPPKPCWYCGEMHFNKDCTNRNKVCHNCKKQGHLAKVCRNKKIVQPVHSIAKYTRNKRKFMSLFLNHHKVKLQIDTASDISIISQGLWKYIGCPKIQVTNFTANHAGNAPLKFIGECFIDVRTESKCLKRWKFYIHENRILNILGLDLFDELKLGDTPLNMIHQVTKDVKLDRGDSKSTNIVNKFPTVFTQGLGKCRYAKAELHLTENTTPIFRQKRTVPIALRELVEKEIERLVNEGVLKPVNYSEWAAPIVTIRKPNGTIRICADFSTGLNKALKDIHYPLPTVEDIFLNFNGGTIFSKMDLSEAYLQVEVEENSQKLLTIHTHKGLYQYTRLPFGIKSAPSIFQQIMDQVLSGLEGVSAYLDDIIIIGKTEEEHENRLNTVLEKLDKWGLKVRAEKCELFLREIKFLGFIINREGIFTDPDKTNAIDNMPEPRNITELRSFLGFVNYYSKFVPNLHNVKQPMEELLCKDRQWIWTNRCQKAFNRVKEIIKSPLLLTHFDPKQELIVAADASSTGVGAVLLHRFPDGSQKAIAHASKSLSPAQRNYGQIEKEAYALVFAVNVFHKYLWGHKFILWTDHKPLLAIFGAKTGIPQTTANRLQRWAIHLLGYDFTLEHKSTKEFGEADALSRLIGENTMSEEMYVVAAISTDEVESEIVKNSHLQLSSLPVAEKELITETERDHTLKKVTEYTLNGWPNSIEDETTSHYSRRRQDISLVNGCLLNGERIIIPKTLRERILRQLHKGHPGIQRMKALARYYVYWERIDKDIENLVKECEPCATHTKAPIKTLLHSWPKPETPWSRVHIDYAGPLNGKHYLVLVDSFSKWPEVIPTKNISSKATIEILREIFSRFGLPDTLVSDNGSQFTSIEFAQFCNENGITHVRSPPYHPQSNGQAERFVDTLKRGLAKLKGEEECKALQEILFSYRYTPSDTIPENKSPAEIFLGRKIRNTLNMLWSSQKSAMKRNERMEIQFNRHHGARERSFRKGDGVWIQNNQGNPHKAGIVIQRIGKVLYDIKVGDQCWRRHVNQLQRRYNSDEQIQISNKPKNSIEPVRRSNRLRMPPLRFV